jgi:hypothetical protein
MTQTHHRVLGAVSPAIIAINKFDLCTRNRQSCGMRSYRFAITNVTPTSNKLRTAIPDAQF